MKIVYAIVKGLLLTGAGAGAVFGGAVVADVAASIPPQFTTLVLFALFISGLSFLGFWRPRAVKDAPRPTVANMAAAPAGSGGAAATGPRPTAAASGAGSPAPHAAGATAGVAAAAALGGASFRSAMVMKRRPAGSHRLYERSVHREAVS